MNNKRKSISHDKFGYVFIIPFVVFYLVFSLYPIVYTSILGFTDFSDTKGFINGWHFLKDDPFQAYKKVFSLDLFKTSLFNTFYMWGLNFAPQIILALVLAAWFTSRRNKLYGQSFFKVVFYMPNIITAASVALLFYNFCGYPKGPLNDLLGTKIDFVNKTTIAPLIVSFIQFWMWYGYTMLILISGILGINPEIYESADVDGANGLQAFFKITLPNLKTVLLYTMVTSLVGGLNMYDVPASFNLGGPDNKTTTVNMFIKDKAFTTYTFNEASAASMLVFIIIAILSAFIFMMLRDKDEAAERKINKAAEKAMKKKAKEALKNV